jgi:hypothetical protein
MADTITIPSPSVFLRASPDPVPRLDTDQQVLDDEKNKAGPVKKRNTTRKKSTASTSKPRRDGAAVAPCTEQNNVQVVSPAKPNA